MVHHALQAVGGRGGALVRAVAGLVCAAALLSGCASGGGSAPGSPTVATHSVATVRQASCTDWERGDDGERLATVLALRHFAGGEVGSSTVIRYGRVLDDDRAYDVLQSWCTRTFARGFKLYKLYERAASFVGTPAKPPAGL